eukprot:scaffold152634_cov31-Tisochrysis_lutea.AAC.11
MTLRRRLPVIAGMRALGEDDVLCKLMPPRSCARGATSLAVSTIAEITVVPVVASFCAAGQFTGVASKTFDVDSPSARACRRARLAARAAAISTALSAAASPFLRVSERNDSHSEQMYLSSLRPPPSHPRVLPPATHRSFSAALTNFVPVRLRIGRFRQDDRHGTSRCRKVRSSGV